MVNSHPLDCQNRERRGAFRKRVLHREDAEVLSTQSGQQAIALLVNLVARFCPAIEVDVPGQLPLHLPVAPLLRWDKRLQDALVTLPDGIWGPAKPAFVDQKPPDLVVSIGPPSSSFASIPCLQLSFGHWWGAVAERGELPETAVPGDCLGPLVAACLAAGSTFKAALRDLAQRYPDSASDNTWRDLRPGGRCLSLLDYTLAPADSSAPAREAFPQPVVFVSAGAICTATAYGLHAVGIVLPAATVFEPKLLDPPDLNRYVTASAAELDQSKTSVMADWIPSTGAVDLKCEAFTNNVGPTDFRGDELFVVGVDHVPSRWFAQAVWPRHLLIGATEHDQLRVSSHPYPLGPWACAQCLDSSDSPTMPGEVIPTVSFVSALTGLMIAAEMVKMADPAFATSCLRNVVGGRVLQLGQPWNWQMQFHERVTECELCREAA